MKRKLFIFLLITSMILTIITPALAAETVTATPTASTVLVNGKTVAFDAYTINGNNYFKLRDLAYTLSGTAKQFDVGWDGANNAISLTSGKAYTATGGEMTAKGAGSKSATPTSSKIYLDGKEVTLTAYTIEGNNYFKLRDIGLTFDFSVEWDGAKNTIVIDMSKGYTPEGTVPTTSTVDKPFKQAGAMSDITDVSQGTAIYTLINDVISSPYNCVFVYNDGTFRANNNITYGEFFQMVFHSIIRSDLSITYKYNPAPDYDHWAKQYVDYNKVSVSYYATKLTYGKSFNFDKPITRSDMAILAYEYYILANEKRAIMHDTSYFDKLTDKDDIPTEYSTDTPAKYIINCALQAGLIKPDTNGKLNPNGYVTREEALSICQTIRP